MRSMHSMQLHPQVRPRTIDTPPSMLAVATKVAPVVHLDIQVDLAAFPGSHGEATWKPSEAHAARYDPSNPGIHLDVCLQRLKLGAQRHPLLLSGTLKYNSLPGMRRLKLGGKRHPLLLSKGH